MIKKVFKLAVLNIIVFVMLLVFSMPQKVSSNVVCEENLFEKFTIVLDAGHGFPDGGAVGKITGIKESDLNLEYAFCLESYLKSAGFKVVQTRTNANALADFNILGGKQADMQARKKIIETAKPNMVISIHMNKFSMEYVKGAQTFYQKGDEKSERLAQNIQSLFVSNLNSPKTLHLGGDFFMCKCFNCPSVIVECGFLSNKDEEQNLINPEYKNKVCYSIFCGIIKYFCN